MAFPQVPARLTEALAAGLGMQRGRESLLEDRFGGRKVSSAGAVMLGFSIPEPDPPLLPRVIDAFGSHFFQRRARSLRLFLVLGECNNDRTAAPKASS